MNHTKIVREYIETIDADTPILLSDVKKLVGENAKMILTRLVKENVIARFGYGIYYKPTQTIWGDSVIGNDMVIQTRYIEDGDGNIKGYVTGLRLLNRLGLTTQVPRMTEIVSNECKGKNKITTEYGAIVQRPKLRVDNENYLYQQLFDIVENKNNIQVETEQMKAILQSFYRDNKLDFATLYKVGMARGASAQKLHKMSEMILGG